MSSQLSFAALRFVLLLGLSVGACDLDRNSAAPTSSPVVDANGSAPLDAGRDDAGLQGPRDAAVDGPEAGAPAAFDGASREAGSAEAGPSAVQVPDGAVSMFPAPGSQGVCIDAPFRVRFGAPPALGSAGRLRVFEAASATGSPAAELDMTKSVVSDVVDGVRLDMPRRAYIDGNEAVFYLPRGALGPGRSYFVSLERGALSDPDGKPFVLDGSAWTFTTGTPKPSAAHDWSVALDGSGDFCTLQSAIDAIPAGNTTPITVAIAPGTYHEIIHWKGKSQVTLSGGSRDQVILSGVNNETLNSGTAKRALVAIDDSSAVVIEDLTIHNLTPQGGSQAEALRMQNCDQCIVRRASVRSLQDTLLWSGRIFAQDSYIEGNVDYVWGTGVAYFDHCELHTKGRNGYIVQARNPAATYGYVFVDCRLTSDPGIQGDILARIDASSYPASHVAFIDCEMGSHIAPSGWVVTGAGSTQALRFWEYGSRQPDGRPVDVSARLPSATPLSSSQADTMRSPSAVLGGWTPH